MRTTGLLLGVNWSVDDGVAGRATMAKDPHCDLFPRSEAVHVSLPRNAMKGRDEQRQHGRDLKSFIPSEGRPDGSLLSGAAAMQRSHVATALQAWAAVSLIQF